MKFDLIVEEIINGLAKGKTLEDLAKKHGVSIDHLQNQLNRGIEIEIEHTKQKKIAKKIAMDHLFEDPDYYTKLLKLEKK